LALVEQLAARNEEVNFFQQDEVNDVEGTVTIHRVLDRGLLDEELRFHGREQPTHIPRLQLDQDVGVVGRAGLAERHARHGPADGVWNPEAFQDFNDPRQDMRLGLGINTHGLRDPSRTRAP
jgi:hypothetical protein